MQYGNDNITGRKNLAGLLLANAAKDASMVVDSTGDTSARSETAPVNFFVGGFTPKTNPKPPLTIEEQSTHLAKRNLDVSDDAKFYLSRISYYHLSAYYPLFCEGKTFRDGTCIADIINACNFDRTMQADLFKFIGVIEVRLRAVIANELALAYGSLAHIYKPAYTNADALSETIKRYRAERDQQYRKGNEFVVHNMAKYGELPVWAAVDVMTLGTLSRLYGNLAESRVREGVAKQFCIPYRVLRGWVKMLTYTRNESAHFGRLYGKRIAQPGQAVRGIGDYDNRSIFHICAVIAKMLSTDDDTYRAVFIDSVDKAIRCYGLETEPIGFVKDWKEKLTNL